MTSRRRRSRPPGGALKWFALGVLLACPDAALAGTSVDAVSGVLTFDDGHVVVRFENTTQHGCANDPWFSLGTAGSPQQESMRAIALSALVSGHRVAFSTTNGVCQGGEEKVNWLSIER